MSGNYLDFTGDDNLSGFAKYVGEILVKNELGGISDGYHLDHADKGVPEEKRTVSGYSFGGNQMDLANNSRAREVLRDILVNARNANDQLVELNGAAFYQSISAKLLLKGNPDALSKSEVSRIDAAFNTVYGKLAINLEFVFSVSKNINEVNAIINSLPEGAIKETLANSQELKLYLCDYHNQFGIETDGKMYNFLKDVSSAGNNALKGMIVSQNIVNFVSRTDWANKNPSAFNNRYNFTKEYIESKHIGKFIIGNSEGNVIRGSDFLDTLHGGAGEDTVIGGTVGDALWGNVNTTHRGDGQKDTFITFGGEIIKDADAADRVYLYGLLEPTGGIKWAPFEDPVALGQNGFAYRVLGGDINDAEGGTLEVKFLWDNSATVILEHYNRDFATHIGDAGIEIYQESYGERTGDWVKNYIKGFQAAFGTASADPLILDLGAPGFNFRSNTASNVYFNVEGGSFAHRVGWTKEDGFLVQDVNNNSKIDSIAEMFGNGSASGFAALKALDSNKDNKFTPADTAWNSVKIWVDADGDGVTDAGELQSLLYHNITGITLTSAASTQTLNGNAITAISSYTKTNGATGAVADVRLEQNPIYTKYVGNVAPSAAANALPWLHGWGELADLNIAMTQDAGLLGLVENLKNMPIADPASFNDEVETILYRWAGAQNVASGSRGAHINAKQLAFVEAFTGRPFAGNPSVDDSGELSSLWNNAFRHAKAALLAQGPYKAWFSSLAYDKAQDAFMPTSGHYLRAAMDKILSAMPANPQQAQAHWNKFAALLPDLAAHTQRPNGTNGFGLEHLVTDIAFAMEGKSLPMTLESLVSGIKGNVSIHADNGEDFLSLSGGNRNDILAMQGAYGNMQGGSGDDTYIVAGNFSAIDIQEDSGFAMAGSLNPVATLRQQVDTLRFTHLTASQATLTRDGEDLLIGKHGTADTVRVVNHFGHATSGWFMNGAPDHAIEQIVFADGKAKTSVDIRGAIISAQQTDGNDFIKGTSDNDLLRGKKGNDTLEGGDDGDSYIFNIGDGKDTITDTMQDVFLTDPDILVFGEGISLEDTVFTRGEGDELIITFAHAQDSVTINNQFWVSPLGLGNFNAVSTAFQAILNNPLAQLASVEEFPENFDSTGYANTSGVNVVKKPNGDLAVEIVNTYDYTVPGGTRPDSADFMLIPAPNERIETFSFRDGATLTAEAVQQRILEKSRTTGDDAIRGFFGADTLDGGAGNDTLDGGNGGDTYLYKPGYGHDVIHDQMQNVLFKDADTVIFGAGITAQNTSWVRNGNDMVISFSQAPRDKLTIADQFHSSVLGLNSFYSLNNRMEKFVFADGAVWTAEQAQQKLLTKTAGDDVLSGFFSQDILDGGAGNDTLDGGNMGDTYIFGYGYGHDVAHDSMDSVLFKQNDKLVFGPGITKQQVRFAHGSEEGDLVISLTNSKDTFTIKGQFAYSVFGPASIFSLNNGIEEFYFADKSAYTYKDIQDILLKSTPGNDRLTGFFRQDTLDGGAGNDRLEGKDEADTYIFARGYGHDVILDESRGIADTWDDRIVFTGLASADITFSRPLNTMDLKITLKATGETLTLLNQHFVGNIGQPPSEIEKFQFTDTTLTPAQVRAKLLVATSGHDRITGFFTDDTLQGGLGNDTLDGGDGSDIYLFKLGDGHDVIREDVQNVFYDTPDTLAFGNGITSGMLAIARMGDDMKITFTGNSDSSLLIRDYFLTYFYEIERFTFQNGTVWGKDRMLARLIGADGSDNFIKASPYTTQLCGIEGNDTIDGGNAAFVTHLMQGGNGNDTYLFGVGYYDDHIVEYQDNLQESSVDTLRITGYRFQDLGFTRSYDSLIITTTDINDQITIQGYYANSRNKVEKLVVGGVTYTMDALIGNAGSGSGKNDIITGDDTDETIRTYEGHDKVTAAGGADYIDGGTGNDTIDGGYGSDTVDGGDGNDVLEGFVENDYIRGGKGNDLIDQLNGFGDDTLVGGDGNDTLFGYGEDKLYGEAGDDTLYIGTENAMVINGGSGSDTLRFTLPPYAHVTASLISNLYAVKNDAGAEFGVSSTSIVSIEHLVGGEGNDVLTGNAGNNRLDGGSWGNDALIGGDGLDTLAGGVGMDTLQGGLGNDALDGGDDADKLYGEDGNDTLSGGAGVDYLAGGAGNDSLSGSDSGDHLTGGDGLDFLKGDGGNDRLYGDAGKDTLSGGVGNDVFYFTSRMHSVDIARDVILDFTHLVDKIDLVGLGFIGIQSGASSGSMLGYGLVSGNTVIDAANSDFSIELTGAITLSATDFIF